MKTSLECYTLTSTCVPKLPQNLAKGLKSQYLSSSGGYSVGNAPDTQEVHHQGDNGREIQQNQCNHHHYNLTLMGFPQILDNRQF